MENFSENNETRQIVPNYRSSSKLNNSGPQNYISSNNLDSNSSGSNNTNTNDIGNINNNVLLNSKFIYIKGNNSEYPIKVQDKFIPVLQRRDYRLFPNCYDEDMKPE